jgi:exodeoxyribonuclease V alpha subunit
MTTSIDGTISRVVFHKPSRYSPSGEKFLIARLSDGTTIKGSMSKPVIGEPYRFWGEHKAQKGGYGDAFEFASFEPLCDQSCGGVANYLTAHVDGIGPVKAEALVDRFGVETLTILRTDPAKALEVDGITEAVVAAIRAHFDDATALDPVAYSRLIEMFAPYRVSKKIVERLVKSFGSSAPDKILENPYLLLAFPRIGWKTVDAFATTTAGYPPEGIERHKAAVLEAMERISNDGHTATTETDILNAADALLGCHLDKGVLAELVASGDVIEYRDDYGPVYQLDKFGEAEATIAEKLAVLMAAESPLPAPLVTDEWAAESGLADEQIGAVRLIERHPVVILSGAPGTGKSWTLSRTLGRLREIGVSGIRVTAPTGKAAKRAGELLDQVEACRGIPATTIHKALAPSPGMAPEGIPQADAKFGRGREEFSFGKDEAHPFDDRVIVVDETSMVDCRLMASLLRAVKPGTRVIFVGDANQLPSVGPGSVLRDLMAAGVPTATLNQIRRSDGGGTVVRACHAIKDGFVPSDAPAIDLPTENWIHLEIGDPNAIAAKIVELNTTTRRFDPMWEMQVISAQKAKHAFGCDNLNRLLSQALNPVAHGHGQDDGNDGEGGPDFRVGDKVIRVKNGLVDEMVPWAGPDEIGGKSRPDLTWRRREWATREVAIVNGDMGSVEHILLDDKPAVIVRLRDPERLVRLPYGDAHLLPAYAITCHKAQGSGFPYVVVPVHQAFYPGLFTRELFYTAISRAEQLLITVGQWSAIEAAVGRKTVHKRQTTLVRRLAEATAGIESQEADQDEAAVTTDVTDDDFVPFPVAV